MSPQFDGEEAIHWYEGHFGRLIDVLPQTPANVHPSRETEGCLSDVLSEDRDDGDARSNGHCGKTFTFDTTDTTPLSVYFAVLYIVCVCLLHRKS